MFTAEAMIDTIQGAKKTWVKTFVTNEQVATALNGFVDAQADYTKKAVKVSQDTATTLVSESVKAYQNASKFDYTKFGEGIMKAYNANSYTKK
jgi:hypothetical protein